MQDAVAVALETGAKWICFYGMRTIASTECTCSKRCKSRVFARLALGAINDLPLTRARPRVFVCETNLIV
jgi:hypothetical protein